MVSDGGVHSGFEHLHALIELAGELAASPIWCCTASPTAATPRRPPGEGYLERSRGLVPRRGRRPVASVVGRYYAMDRDRRWERTQAAYDLLVHGRGRAPVADAPGGCAAPPTQRGETDEFITPTVVGDEGRIRAADSVLCFNFRPDRMREIVRALAEPGFGEGAEELPGWRGRDGASRCDGSRR